MINISKYIVIGGLIGLIGSGQVSAGTSLEKAKESGKQAEKKCLGLKKEVRIAGNEMKKVFADLRLGPKPAKPLKSAVKGIFGTSKTKKGPRSKRDVYDNVLLYTKVFDLNYAELSRLASAGKKIYQGSKVNKIRDAVIAHSSNCRRFAENLKKLAHYLSFKKPFPTKSEMKIFDKMIQEVK